MRLLDKEQAEWLIEKLNTNYFKSTDDGTAAAIRDIINQCTEKEFPSYFWADKDDDDACIELSLFCETGNMIKVKIFESNLNLYPKQFEAFTEGCNKIVEWLQEQK